jgi:hypothetical protein
MNRDELIARMRLVRRTETIQLGLEGDFTSYDVVIVEVSVEIDGVTFHENLITAENLSDELMKVFERLAKESLADTIIGMYA